VVQSNEPVEVFGYLQKKGRRLKAWHQRWFEIRGQHMYYFKSNSKKQCLGEIQLSICSQVRASDVASFGHPFEVVTKERTHILAARTTEDMEKWIDAINKNMGPRSGSSPKKANKVKKWDSFKNAFHIHRSVSPQRSNPIPSVSVPTEDTQVPVADVVRNKSFLDKFRRIKRDRSNSAERRTAELRDQEKRPLSEDVSYSQNKQQLVAALTDPPVAVSVPNSPLSRKKSSPVGGRKRKSFSPGSQTPGGDSSGGLTPRSTPERSTPDPSPRHTSTPMTATKDMTPSPPKVTLATPRPPVNNSTKLSPHRETKKLPTPPSPLASNETPIPEIFTKPLVWDEVKVLLDSTQDSEHLFPEDSLFPRDEPWMEKESPIDQLREFLAVCP
jgi:hypothetical protein